MDCRWLGTHPTLRTALAFCEAWPPDNFPITFYRTPTCPDWELTVSSLDLDALAAVPLAYVSGTGFAIEPSRLATQSVLEARAGGDRHDRARPGLAGRAVGRPGRLRRLHARRPRAMAGRGARLRRGVAAAVGTADAVPLVALGVGVVANKHGGRGVTVYVAGQRAGRGAGPPGRGRERPRRRATHSPPRSAGVCCAAIAGGTLPPWRTGPAHTSPRGWAVRSRCQPRENCRDARPAAAKPRPAGDARCGRMAMAVLQLHRVAGSAGMDTGQDEVCLVNLGGRLSATAGGERFDLGARETPFDALPDALYLPPGTRCTVEGEGWVARCAARADRGPGRRGAADPGRVDAGRGARVGQRHPPDHAHHPARVCRPQAAGGRGADAGRQLVVLPAAQA